MLTSGVGAMTTPQITTGQSTMMPKNSVTQPNAGWGGIGHEFSGAPYSLAHPTPDMAGGGGTGIGGIGGTTRQFGGKW